MSFDRNIILALAAAAVMGGCAAAQTPPELVDARRAYAHASEGPARQLVPAELLSAEQALQRAEKSFADSSDSSQTKDLSYLAQRRAELADARGILASDSRDKAQAQADLQQLGAQASVQLSETRAELASERMVLANEQQARKTAESRLRAAMASLEKIAAIKQEERGLVITLNGSVLFVTNQAALLPIAQDRLAEVAKALQDNPNSMITVEGHTDSTGSASLNEELSLKRAQSVREYLVTHGIPADRVRAVGIGAARPIADNKTPEGRANNRRVEIIVQPEKK